MRLRHPILLTALLLGMAPSGAHADEPPPEAVQAFKQGLDRMRAGDCLASPPGSRRVCERALADFDHAYHLRPSGLGALRNRAFIERSLGLYASAAASFAELEQKARHDPSEERRAWAVFAREEVARLGPNIPTLTVTVAARTDAATLELDGRTLGASELGRPIKLDPGTHQLLVRRPGEQPQTMEVTLAAGTQRRLTVAHPTAGQTTPEAEWRPSAPLLVAGAGAAVTAVGLGLGAVSWSMKSRACDADNVCDDDLLDRGRGYARASTIVTIAGAAGLAGGLVWFAVAPSEDRPNVAVAPWATPGGTGLLARARF